MKKHILLLSVIFTFSAQTHLHAQGSAFTYQGRLLDAASPANGSYDFQFIVYDNNPGGSQQGPLQTKTAVAVSNGLFNVTLDFGLVFPGANRWLDISVRTNGSAQFAELSPRQALTPTPYAITAGSVTPGTGLAGTYGGMVTLSNSANSFSGSFTGNGSNVTNVNATTFSGLSPNSFWLLNGNNVAAGQFLGSTNNQPVVIMANNLPAMRLYYATNTSNGVSPNVIGGSSANFVSNGVVGATIIGGGGTTSRSNRVNGDFATVIGGRGNVASGVYSVAGGTGSSADGYAAMAMGNAAAEGDFSTAFGGSVAYGAFAVALGDSTANGPTSFSCGNHSQANGTNSVAMGEGYASGNDSIAVGRSSAAGNFSAAFATGEADGAYSFAAGNQSWAQHDGCFVWADNSAGANVGFFQSTASNQFLVQSSGGVGINTSAPHAKMLTVGTPNGAYGIEQTDGNIRVGTYVGGSTGGGWMGTISNHKFSLYVNSGPPTLTLNTNGLVGIGTTTPSSALQVVGTVTATAFNPSSDREIKENFKPVSAQEVLNKVTALPITQWNFKSDTTTPHIGPMAQDFYAAFAVGTDNKHIATVDESGVALAAIQGLNQKLTEKDTEIQTLKKQNDALANRLNELEASVKQLLAR